MAPKPKDKEEQVYEGLPAELAAAIRRGYAQRDRHRMEPTIDFFRQLLARYPEHAVVRYELAGAYDTAGQEERACELYEEALDQGLSGEPLRRCLCQYASTLRWLGELEASRKVLDRAHSAFPDSEGVKVFSALTHLESNKPDAAVGELLEVITAHAEATDLGRWNDGLANLGRWLRAGRPED
ncbi:tetratricopeptide repeat protein [Glutamicibacter sp. PS]|uniref:tetratricopeptide repeat protein n=1 Tax=Glutamicibacter sp. PS TaxID=3075634 RepID=UPI00284F01FC|nr:tetratricopeptide repeat protein [Glutamicibacter sp. PS]MDR4534463.1 tetratricopeptide repeat protein [Glutamicibacter sp. PS]